MTSIVSGLDYSVLFGSSSTDASTSILTALYSTTSSTSTASSTGNPILDLKLAQQNEARDVAQEAKNPTVVRDLQAFTQGIANAKTLNDALNNPNVMKVLLTANGLSDQLQYTALAKKALLSDPSASTSLVNQLTDTRWKTLAQTYDLASKGLAGLQDPTVQSQIASAYETVTWMTSLDAATPGLAEALQFKQKASSITTVDGILGDTVNRDVVLTALNIPQQIAFQDLTAQEQAVSSRLDLSKLQDPNFVNTLTDQYLLAKQTTASSSSSSSSSLLSLSIRAAGLVV
jgi:hypothetical protein